MKRIVVTFLALTAAGYFATSAQDAPKKHIPRAQRVREVGGLPVANVGFANAGVANVGFTGFGFGIPMGGFAYPSYGFGYPSFGFGYPSYGFGMPVYFANVGNQHGLPRYDYTTDAFGGSPYGGNYDYWLTRQAAHGNISWAQANHHMQHH
jgi:hypothetical protein